MHSWQKLFPTSPEIRFRPLLEQNTPVRFWGTEGRLGRRGRKGKKPHAVPELVRSTWIPKPNSIHLSLSLQYKQKKPPHQPNPKTSKQQ